MPSRKPRDSSPQNWENGNQLFNGELISNNWILLTPMVYTGSGCLVGNCVWHTLLLYVIYFFIFLGYWNVFYDWLSVDCESIHVPRIRVVLRANWLKMIQRSIRANNHGRSNKEMPAQPSGGVLATHAIEVLPTQPSGSGLATDSDQFSLTQHLGGDQASAPQFDVV